MSSPIPPPARSQVDSKPISTITSSTAYSSGPRSSFRQDDPHPHHPHNLTRFTLFQGLSESELGTVSSLLQPRFIGSGLTFIRQGCSGTGVFFLQQGTVKVCVAAPCEKEPTSGKQQCDVILSLCGPGETLGEIDAADGNGHTATVITLEPSHCLWMSSGDFKRFYIRLPKLQVNLSLLLAARVRLLTTSYAVLATLPLSGKIAYSLLLLAHRYGESGQDGSILLPLRLTQEELAAWVGSSREAVNRTLSNFKRAGHIAVGDNGYFLIQQSGALRQHCPHAFPGF